MANQLRFSLADIRKADAECGPCKWAWAKDHSTYLMPTGQTEKNPETGTMKHIIYANGLDPDKVEFDVWWERVNRICGGDDFGEYFDADFMDQLLDFGKGAKWLVLTVRKNDVAFSVAGTATP